MQLTGADKKTKIDGADAIFAQEFNEGLVHQVLVAQQAGARQGSVSQKTRAEVSGGGKKPWKQKGTGNARAGSTRGPIWRHGGVTFAAKPRSYKQKVNRKMYRGAIRSMLSELLRQERLLVTEDLAMKEVKTKLLADKLAKWDMPNVLIVEDSPSDELLLSARNLPHVSVVKAAKLDPVMMMRHHKVLLTKAAVKKIEEWLS